MELTLDQALQKGIEAHKAGQTQEADLYYTAILKANPKHPDANHNMGVLAVGVDKVTQALPFFETALEVLTLSSSFISLFSAASRNSLLSKLLLSKTFIIFLGSFRLILFIHIALNMALL